METNRTSSLAVKFPRSGPLSERGWTNNGRPLDSPHGYLARFDQRMSSAGGPISATMYLFGFEVHWTIADCIAETYLRLQVYVLTALFLGGRPAIGG